MTVATFGAANPRKSKIEIQLESIPPLLEIRPLPRFKETRRRIVYAGMTYNPAEIPLLLSGLESQDFITRWGAAWSLGSYETLTPETQDALMAKAPRLVNDDSWRVRSATAGALSHLGERAVPMLQQLAIESRGEVHDAAISALERIGEPAAPVLEKLAQDVRPYVRRGALEAAERMRSGTQNARAQPPEATVGNEGLAKALVGFDELVFMNPKPTEEREWITTAAEISQILKEEFKDEYSGVVILGPTERRFMTKEPQWGYAVVSRTPEAAERFKKEAKGRLLGGVVHINPDQTSRSENVMLFSGLFIGDEKRLEDVQQRILSGLNPLEWDLARETRLIEAANLDKAESLGLSRNTVERLSVMRAVLYMPPDFETMKRSIDFMQHPYLRKSGAERAFRVTTVAGVPVQQVRSLLDLAVTARKSPEHLVHHLEHGDLSRWIKGVVGDVELSQNLPKTVEELPRALDERIEFLSRTSFEGRHPLLNDVELYKAFQLKKNGGKTIAVCPNLSVLRQEVGRANPDDIEFHLSHGNDLSRWVDRVLGDEKLARRLSAVNADKPKEAKKGIERILAQRIVELGGDR
jgi:hypothetical protein